MLINNSTPSKSPQGETPSLRRVRAGAQLIIHNSTPSKSPQGETSSHRRVRVGAQLIILPPLNLPKGRLPPIGG